MPFPEAGLVYDYTLDDAGISSTKVEDEEEAGSEKQVCSFRAISILHPMALMNSAFRP